MLQNLFYLFLIASFVNPISVKQYSDDQCTILSRYDYVKESGCYPLTSTASYFFKSCNCTLIEYDLYNSGSCLGSVVANLNAQENTCLSTRQKIFCYDYKENEANYLSTTTFFILVYNLINILIN